MQVKMRTTYAGPGGTCQAGQVINLEDALAQSLIESGQAVKVIGGKQFIENPVTDDGNPTALEVPNFERMKVKEIAEWAEANEFDLDGATSKKDMIAKIKDHLPEE